MFKQNNPNYSPVSQFQITPQGMQYGNPNYSPVSQPNSFTGQQATVPVVNPMEQMNPGALQNTGQFTGMQKWWGGQNAAGASTMGYVPAGLGVASFGLNAYLGMKNYSMAKKQLNLDKEKFGFEKDLAETNLSNQANTVNASIEERQRMANIQNPGQFASVADHMKKYGVQGNV